MEHLQMTLTYQHIEEEQEAVAGSLSGGQRLLTASCKRSTGGLTGQSGKPAFLFLADQPSNSSFNGGTR